ncbi:hypothetical protein FZEAL_2506 [Fusarium zealandicum]|uniref:Nephrocystin 3-like N-terminal domain-containing protein n=1 Tax=Fusarium zealandicum TaxID=1053134 RepID=A0A8H4UQJ7_9HYPO|nr:hypothetical protein FZEAL_2506 [Fusarium zealandicum]
MAEVVGLVAASGQFLEQSIKIIKFSKALHDKIQDAPDEIEAWRSQMTRLRELVQEICDTPSLQTTNISDTIKDCNEIGYRLGQEFDQVDFDSTDTMGRKTWKAVKGLAKEGKICDNFAQLERLKTTLLAQMSLRAPTSRAQGNETMMRFDDLRAGIDEVKNSMQPGSDEDHCLRALFVTDTAADRAGIVTARGERAPKTCEWITSSHEYKSWQQGSPSLLWISGPPGKGKTFLSIFLSHHLEDVHGDSPSSVIFFFCDNKVSSRNTATSILRGLMSQLAQSHPSLLEILIRPWKVQQDSLFKESSFEILWRTFREMLEALGTTPTYCVLDALDECDEESLTSLLKKLKSLFDPKVSVRHSLKLLILSRKHPVCLQSTLSTFPQLHLDGAQDDIEIYIKHRVSQLGAMMGIEDHKLLRHVETTFFERAEGTFLWVSFMADDLESKPLEQLEETLKNLPRGLKSVYERILLQIEPTSQTTIAAMLSWITLAAKPLSVEAICQALDIQATKFLGPEEICENYVKCCGNLLQLTPVDSEHDRQQPSKMLISFVHQSAKEFLITRHEDPQIGKLLVNQQQSQKSIANNLIRRLVQLDEKMPVTALDIYAWRYAEVHIGVLGNDVLQVMDDNCDFFSRRKMPSGGFYIPNFFDRLFVEDPFRRRWKFSLTHYASDYGHLALLQHLLQKKNIFSYLSPRRNVNKRSFEGSTALLLACESGHMSTVKLLLRNGADIHSYNFSQETPLQQASKNGQAEVVELLLQYGSDPNFVNQLGDTSLSLACRGGHINVVDILFRNGANPNQQTSSYILESSLHAAGRIGNIEMVELLLRYNADPRLIDFYGYTPLHTALQYRKGQVFDLLVRSKWGKEVLSIDVSGKSSCNKNFLHLSAASGLGDMCTRMIEEMGYDIDTKTKDGHESTAVYFALQGGHCDLAQIFDGLVDINHRDSEGRTMLHVCVLGIDTKARFCIAEGGDLTACGFVKVALHLGADLYIKDAYSDTAYDLAMQRMRMTRRVSGHDGPNDLKEVVAAFEEK